MRLAVFDWAQRVWIGLGVLAFLGAALWCIGGAGIYGSPLTGMDTKELLKVWAFLLVGPFSMLPAAILATARPRYGGLWSVVAGLLSGYLIWFVIPHPNLRGGFHFEAIAPLLLVSVPMLVVGVWQLLSGAVRVEDILVGARSRIANRPILAAILLLLVGILLGRVIRRGEESPAPQSVTVQPTHSEHKQDQATTWTCSIHPYLQKEPGKCPICGLDLIPMQKQPAGGLR